MLGLAGLLVSLLVIGNPPVDLRAIPASTYRGARIQYTGLSVPVRFSNHLVGMFGPAPPLAYGLDLQAGVELCFDDWILLRVESGYAFVHHVEFDSHASITGVGIGLYTAAGQIRYEPSFIVGSEARELMLGFRHGLEYAPMQEIVSLQFQHGVVWVGPANARHELRGALTVDLGRIAYWIGVAIEIVGMRR